MNSNTDPYEGQEVSLDQITPISDQLPEGTYQARLVACEAKTPDKGSPFVLATYEIQGGEQAFAEQQVRYYYGASVSKKNGKIYASGLLEIAAALNAAGSPLPVSTRMPLDGNKLATMLARGLQGKTVGLRVYKEEYDDKTTGEKKKATKAKVVQAAAGRVPPTPVGVGAGFNDDVDPFGEGL